MYARIQNDVVLETFITLPENWGPHCGLPRFPKSFLIQQGFLECEEIYPTITPLQKYQGMEFQVLSDKVIVTHLVVDKTPEELQEEQNQLIKMFTNAIQNHLDMRAQEREYDDILSLASYAGDPDPKYNREGTSGKSWRSSCWRYLDTVRNDVLNGLRTIPTVEELISELPVFTWGE